jgi:hypothetical protein
MKPLDQGYPDDDESATHDQRADDSPEEDLVLVLGRNLEIGKDQKKDKEVVNAEGFFYQIAGEKLKSRFITPPEIDDDIETQGNGDPECAPKKGFLDLDLVRPPIENDQIKGEQSQYASVESYPKK